MPLAPEAESGCPAMAAAVKRIAGALEREERRRAARALARLAERVRDQDAVDRVIAEVERQRRPD